jgi:phasin family protein
MVQCNITWREEPMSTETLEQWNKLSRTALESLKELSSINLKLVERLAEQQFELVGASIDASVKGANLAVGTPGFKELVPQQAALVSEYNERVLGIARKTTGIVTEVRDEYSEWVEGRLKDVGTPLARGPVPAAAPSPARKSA